jgi:hypothetical protein
MGLIYDADPLMISSRLDRVAAVKDAGPTVAWNVHDWGLKE